MSTGVRLDVVIVTYESAAHLRACVEPLPDWARVVVVDNASSDGSAELAHELGCEVLRNDTNMGFGAAVNRALREAVRAEHLLLLNPDARIAPEHLERLLDAVAIPGVAVAGPALVDPDGTAQRPWWEFPSASLAWREAFGLHRLRTDDFDRPRDVDFVVGACFLIRTDAFRGAGGFDERYWLYGEEADLCRRLGEQGWQVRYVPDSLAEHVGGASGDGERAMVDEHFVRGYERFVLTHEGSAALVSFRVGNAIGAALRLLVVPTGDRRRAVRARTLRRTMALLARHPTMLTSAAPGSARPGLVVCSLEAWDEVWRRNQFFVRELTDADPSLRVLFVEPAFDPLHELLARRKLPLRRGIGGLRPLPDRPQVLRLQPLKPLPRRLGRWADAALGAQVQHAVARAELADPTLWINDLGLALLVRRCAWPVLYDLTDDWLAAEASPHELAVRAEREATVIDCAGAVVSCSTTLAERKRRNRPIQVVPDAVDGDRFRQPLPRPADLPDEPVAVYVGTLHDDRIDVELVCSLAREIADAHFVFVGPNALSSESRRALDVLTNVTLLGPRPYSQIPAYYQHATVVVVPHNVNDFTESLDPIKAYECVATGRPTLSTPVAGFRGLGAPVTIASRDDFARQLRALLTELPPTAPIPPDLPTWTTRAHDFAEALALARSRDPVPFDPPIRVVYGGHVARRSGGELALLRTLPALRELGVDPHVILGENGPLVDDLANLGVPVEVLPLEPATRDLRRHEVGASAALRNATGALAYSRRLARRLGELEPDLVHTNTLKAAYLGGLAGRLAGIPVVWHIRDRIATDYLPKPAVLATQALATVVPHAVIVNSRATLATLGWRRDLVGRIPHVVVPDPVVVGDPPSPRTRRAGDLTVGMLGRISPWKGQHVFLEAFAKAFPTSGARAVIIGNALFGEDGYERSLHQLCSKLGIADRVAFAGFREDVSAALAELDVLIHASTVPEPFGQVVLEGMAAGLPVIASAAGGPTEIINDGVDGLLVTPNDAGALAGAMASLDANTRARLGAAARVRAASFNPTTTGAAIHDVYRRILGGRDAARRPVSSTSR